MKIYTLSITLLMACLTACNTKSNSTSTVTDTPSEGTIHISVDESFKPLTQQAIQVYEASYPKAHIIAHYKAETECLKDLINNEARLILITRNLDSTETQTLETQLIRPQSNTFAKDAIAMVANANTNIENLSVSNLKNLLNNESPQYTLVVDNQNSAILRYLIDSLNQGQAIKAPMQAAKGCQDLVSYISQTPNSIGFIGINWIADPLDTTAQNYLQKVKVITLKNDTASQYYYPSQYNIGTHDYPLTRSLYFISREPWSGLGTAFATFLCSERGQLIVKSAKLFPTHKTIVFREAQIH